MPCQQPITTWHVVIGGFLQDRARNGMVKLWRKLNRLSSPTVRVDFFRWNESWPGVAEQIWQLMTDHNGGQSRICIYGYSFGAGWGALQLAKELRKRGLHVHWLVLSDPVYRSSWLLGRWLALVQWTIAVPDNVTNVSWFRQRMNWPCGHDLVAADPDVTEVLPAKELKLAHQYMDDASEFHNECERVALL